MVPIEIREVSLIYDTPGGKVPGVKDVTLNIGASEFVCIVGPSGCGKSTLLNIVAGFISPAAGEIRIGGKKVDGHGMDRGVVFQDFAQLFEATKPGAADRVFGDSEHVSQFRIGIFLLGKKEEIDHRTTALR